MKQISMGERQRFEHMLQTGEELLESEREQKIALLQEMMKVRTPELLDQRVVEFLDVQGFPSAEVQHVYEEQKELLKRLFGDPDSGLKKDFLYHGTGFLKYDGEKYQQGGASKETVEVLPKILEEGLRVHHDPWLPEGDMESVSFADSYFYAKWFAAKHMTDETQPEWQLGDPNDFFRFFMADTFRAELDPKKVVEHVKNAASRKKVKKERSSQYENKLRDWTESYRSDANDDISIKNLLNGHSDIEGNFGYVLCLDKESIPYQKLKTGGAHEVRTTESVSSETIRAIGVPLAKIQDMRALLEDKGRSDIEVFAIEAADLHFASFPIQDVVARVE